MSRRPPGRSSLLPGRPSTLLCPPTARSCLPRHSNRGPQHARTGPIGRRPYSRASDLRSLVARRQINAPPEQPTIAIVGAGLTGLTAAYYLAGRYDIPGAKIVLYEAADRVGGWVRTETDEVTVDGVTKTVTFERGPRSLSPGDMLHGKQDRLVLWDLVLNTGVGPVAPATQSQPRYIYYDGRVTALPPHNPLYNAWRDALLWDLIPGAFRWWLRHRTRVAGTFPSRDVSVAEYVRGASGGSDALVNILSAGLHGIWGGDVERLSAMSVFSWLFHASAMPATRAGVVGRRLSEELWRRRFLAEAEGVADLEGVKPAVMTFGRHGMESLPLSLEYMLRSAPNVEIRLGAPVKSISYLDDGAKKKKAQIETATGQVEAYDKVISTLPAQHLAKLTTPTLPALADFHSVSIMAVNIWYPYADLIPPGLGYLIPRSCPREQNPERALGVFFDSNLLVEQTAREGGTKVYVLLGGHYYDDPATPIPDEAQAVEQAKALLERHLGIPRDTPCEARAALKRDCLPQHFVGHHALVSEASGQIARQFGGTLAVAGGSYDRPGVTGALRSGHDIADRLAREDWKATGLEELTEERVTDPLYPLKGPKAVLDYVSLITSSKDE